MSNPYEAPTTSTPRRKEPGPLPPPQAPGLAGHIRIVAVLMIIQGFLELAIGGMLTIMAFVFPSVLAAAIAADPQVQKQGAPNAEEAAWVVMIVYLVMGLGGVIPGLLHVAAGFRNAFYKARTLGLAALSFGLATLPLVVCLPTALILAIYGIVVYLNPASVKAFEMGEDGYSGEAIYVTFFAPRPQPTSEPRL